MYNIEDFNTEKLNLTLASFMGQPLDFSRLREIYSNMTVIEEEFCYDPNEDDEKFWQRCQRFSQYLFEKS